MDDLLNQIEIAINNNLYYLALYCSLALPDICAASESENGETTKTKYINWITENLSQKYPMLDPADFYRFRCSLLHQGTSIHRESGYSRIIFLEPGVTSNVFHNNIMGDAYNIDVKIFVSDILSAVRKWYDAKKNTDTVKTNLSNLLRRYPEGLSPYIVGTPVIG